VCKKSFFYCNMKNSIGPALPPGFKRKLPSDDDENIETNMPNKRSIGPLLPPGLRPSFGEEQVSSDDEFGPKQLIGLTKEQIKEMELEQKILEIEKRASSKVMEAPKELKREDWMLAPPSAKRVGVLNDQKSRSFSRHGVPEDIDQSGWVALPGDTKKKNMPITKPQSKKKDQEYKVIVQDFNATHRSKSLMDQHQEKKSDAVNDLSFKRFDRERDIVGNTLGLDKREKLIQDSKNLATKFSHGSSSFL
jgi:hypothetical protein